MARRRVSYRKKPQNRFGMFLVVIAVFMLMVVVAVRSSELKNRQEMYIAKQEALNQQIEAEKERSKEIEEYRKYTQTKKFVEEVAKDKLGLVYEGEIIFKDED